MANSRLICPTQSTAPMDETYFAKIWWLFFNEISDFMGMTPRSFVGTHASRIFDFPATNYAIGTTFYETDRNSTYVVVKTASDVVWKFLQGWDSGVQANLTNGLGLYDENYLYYVRDYDHVLRWNSLQWEWGTPGERNGFIQGFLVNPLATGWHLCDGATINYLKNDGTTASITLPDLITNPAILKYGDPASATINPAVAPGFTNPTYTATSPTASFSGLGGTTGTPNSLTSTASSGPTAVGSGTHTHNFTPSGSVTVNADGSVNLNASGVVDATGQMQNIKLRPYFRK